MDKNTSYDYFRAIARTRNISTAAEELGISQPALSGYLKRLESSIGSPLVDRASNPISLTDAGKALLEYADKVDALSRKFSQEIDDLDCLKKGKLVIGGAVFFNVTYLPAAVAEFSSQYPGINIEIIDGKVPEITSEALAGRIDLFTTPAKTDEDAFCYEEMLRENIFLCLPPDWAINDSLPKAGPEGYARLSSDDFKKLQDCTFIMLHSDLDIGRKMQELFDKHQLSPQHVLTADQTLTTLELTMAGAGISLVTESTLNHYNAGGSKMPTRYLINPEICSRTMYVAYSRHHYVSSATREFIKILLRHNK